MRRVEIGVLGPLQIVGGDGTPVSRISARAARLLATLVAYGGSASVASLVDLLFGEQSGWDRTHELEKAVSAARTVLETAGASRRALKKIAGGYCIDAACVEWDSARFEALATAGRRLLDEADSQQALRTLREALACWRGDVASELDAATGEPARLEEMRMTAWEHLIEAELAEGHHSEVIGELRKLLRAHPTRERLAEQLLLALYRAGRPADALSEYRRHHNEMAGWGLAPGRALADLANRISVKDPSLAAGHRRSLAPQRQIRSGKPLRLRPLVEWLAEAASASASSIERQVRIEMERLAEPGPSSLEERRYRRRRVSREAVGRSLLCFYGEGALEHAGLHPFRFAVDGQVLTLGVVTRNQWTGAHVSLGGPHEDCALIGSNDSPVVSPFDASGLQPAIVRLAEAEYGNQNVWDADIYRLAHVDLGEDSLRASFALDRFAHYALTLDLLENELLDALAAHDNDPVRVTSDTRANLPMRTAYLPDARSLAGLSSRLCAGGMATLFVYALGPGDYRAILQRRSQRVLNVGGRLSVVPKAFHQPLWDCREEVRLSTTVERELEEELLGRKEVGSSSHLRAVDPYGLGSRTHRMRWLLQHPDSWRNECTGLSINMLTGNYDFSCLVVISDPAFGQRLLPNWEMETTIPLSLRPSGVDHVREVARSDAWADEALFAFVNGLRRLGGIHPGLGVEGLGAP